MKIMVDKKEKVREFIRNNPSLSGNETLTKLKKLGLGIRKTEFLKIFRNEKKLPEPTKQKREVSIPKKFRKAKSRISKPITRKRKTKQLKLPKIPFEKTKFGKIVKDLQKQHGISEQKAIERARVLLKIPKFDFRKLNLKDRFVLQQHGY